MLEFVASMLRFRSVTKRFWPPIEAFGRSKAYNYEVQNRIRLRSSAIDIGCDCAKYEAGNVPAKVEAGSYYDCKPATYPKDSDAAAAPLIDGGFQGERE
jgi:hypothetical protein